MLLTLTLLVLGCSIIVFFSDDFSKLIKKLKKIPGVAVLVPLLIASFIILYFEVIIEQILHQIKLLIDWDIEFLAKILPLNEAAIPMATLITLILTVIVPTLIINKIHLKRSFQPWPYRYLLPLYTLAVMSLMLSLPF